MNIADEIKKQMNVEQELPTLRETVIMRIKNEGQYRVICDTHIRTSNPSFAIEYKYWQPICDWAHSEGLHTSHTYNSRGVKSLVITL